MGGRLVMMSHQLYNRAGTCLPAQWDPDPGGCLKCRSGSLWLPDPESGSWVRPPPPPRADFANLGCAMYALSVCCYCHVCPVSLLLLPFVPCHSDALPCVCPVGLLLLPCVPCRSVATAMCVACGCSYVCGLRLPPCVVAVLSCCTALCTQAELSCGYCGDFGRCLMLSGQAACQCQCSWASELARGRARGGGAGQVGE